MSEARKTVLVIGGGAIGLCVACHAAERGHLVTLIDRDAPDADRCSMGNAGLVVPSHFIPLAAPGMVRTALKMMRDPRSPFYIKPRLSLDLLTWGWNFWRAANAQQVRHAAPILRDLHLASLTEYEKLAVSRPNSFGLSQHGLLMLCKSEQALHEEAQVASLANELGLPAQVLDKAETAAKEPGIEMDIAGAVFFPKDSHLTPQDLIQFLRTRAKELGVNLKWGAQFQSWRIDRRRVTAAITSTRTFEADEFVLCGGAWSTSIARAAGLHIPMQPGKGYSLTLPSPPQLPKLPAILTEARVAITPMGSSLRFAGTMEIAGMDTRINPARAEGIIRSVSRYYPRFAASDFENIAPWAGLRPCPPDGMPYLGRTRLCDNLTIATGHGMMGISLAPVTGRIVSQLLSDEKPDIDLSLLHPDRFI
jgi:D-amino-acid dehydrogenase